MAFIFFDIDGTLWDRENIIPESTKTALRLLKENGHQIFLCSGRTRVFIQNEELLSQGFDGMICGCGTDIEYRGRGILYKKLERDLLIRSMHMFYDYDMPVVMEGRDLLYMDADMIGRDEYGRWLLQSMRDDTRPIRGNENIWEASKFSILIGGTKYQEVIEALRDEYEFLVHGGFVMEAVPKGYSKATGIAAVCDLLGAGRSETYAFGDSANDLDMLDYVSVGIVMGNGSDTAKAHADYVTDDIHADGIYNACRHFSLI